MQGQGFKHPQPTQSGVEPTIVRPLSITEDPSKNNFKE